MASPDRMEYSDSVGAIRVKEKRDLLNAARIQELLSQSPASLLVRLRQQAGQEPSGSDFPVDDLLGAILRIEYDRVGTLDHEELAIPLLRLRHDLFNLKALIRFRTTGAEPRYSPVRGNIAVRDVEESLKGGTAVDWPAGIAAALEEIRPHFEGQHPSDRFDVLLDLAWMAHGREFCDSRRMPLLSHWFRCLEDLTAVKHLWRRIAAERYHFDISLHPPAVHYLDPEILRLHDVDRVADAVLSSLYGPSLKEGLAEWREGGTWMLLERDIDNFLMTELSGAKYLSLGPEPLFGYLAAFENDQKNIRTAYVLKEAGWPEAAIKRAMRRPYV